MSPPQVPSGPDGQEQRVSRGHIVSTAQTPDLALSTALDQIAALVRRYWYCVLAGLLLGAGAGAIYAFKAKVIYQSDVVVAVAPPDTDPVAGGITGALRGVAGLAGLSIGQGDKSGEYLAVLQSRQLAETFIRKHQLLPVLFAKRWDQASQTWRKAGSAKIPTEEDAYRLFDRKVRSVTQDRKSGLVTISMRWSDRKLVAEWAAAYVRGANDLLRERTLREVAGSLAFLEQQLQKSTEVAVRQSVFQLVEAQKKQEMLANVREDFAFRVLDPAKAPDADHFIKPKRPLAIAAGALAGILAGLAAAFWLARRRSAA
jgi:uncharacterized protein involved in exopolysaccharide biosynthesis